MSLPTLLPILLVLCKITGLSLCAGLALAGMGHPRFRDRCPQKNRVDCQKVLNSPAGRILGIPMADLGVIYFGGGIITLLTHFANPLPLPVFFLLALLNLSTLPYTLFSVLYQGLAVRRWCTLCLRVMVLFWVEFFLFFPYLALGNAIEEWPLSVLLRFLPGFGLALAVWFLLRRRLAETVRQENTANQI